MRRSFRLPSAREGRCRPRDPDATGHPEPGARGSRRAALADGEPERLGGVVGGDGDRAGNGTILNEDAAPAVTVADATASEGESMTFTVTLDKAVSGG